MGICCSSYLSSASSVFRTPFLFPSFDRFAVATVVIQSGNRSSWHDCRTHILSIHSISIVHKPYVLNKVASMSATIATFPAAFAGLPAAWIAINASAIFWKSCGGGACCVAPRRCCWLWCGYCSCHTNRTKESGHLFLCPFPLLCIFMLPWQDWVRSYIHQSCVTCIVICVSSLEEI